MAIELKQNLKLSQQLVITPQLQQAIKLLQLSRIELVDMIQSELEENPVLEEGPQIEDEEVPAEMAKEIETEASAEEPVHSATQEVGSADGQMKEPEQFDWENYIGTYNAPGEDVRSFKNQDELPSYENTLTKAGTLSEHLEWQLHMSNLTEEEDANATLLLGYLDDNGYLTLPLEEIAAKEGIEFDLLDDALAIIQDLDPAGVGARDLRECLLLQVRKMEDRSILETLIKEHLNLLERRDYPTLSRKLKVPLKKVILLAKIISELEPKPGRPFGRNDTQYITPDVFVQKVGSDYAIILNEEGLPRLRVSNFYRNMLGEQKIGQAKEYVQDKLKSAMWLIKSIHQRQRTLYRVSKCIVKFQRAFFDKGVEGLKPMVLRDVAEEIGVHESTVSRATTNKYMHTPQGIFELKYFFSSGVSALSGSDVASESVKEKIRQLISQENLKDPLSDIEIVALLKQSNIDIARRTVAKYREMMGILPSSRRKQLY